MAVTSTGDDEAPTRVVLHTIAGGPRRPIAVFHRDPTEGVTLEVLDDGFGVMAQDTYDNGAPYDAEDRMVPRSEPETFMRALLQPSHATYFWYSNELGPTGQ